MATIDKKLIHFNRKADFEARLAAGDIRDYSIVCIKDAKLIWTHGQYYGDLTECLKVTQQTLTDAEKAQVMENLGIEIPTKVSDLENDSSFVSAVDTGEEVDGVEADYVTEAAMNAALSSKQNTITDLSTIRSGASKGATAVQPAELASVAKSGSYNDLKDKPAIPSAVTESTVSGWGFTKNTGTYSKPSAGIPKSDLASAVQTSLGKADTALQSYTEQYKGTITGVSANGTSVATSGVANIPAASTSAYGVTKLSSSTSSTSTSLAATASAVKAAYDLANSYKGTVTGVKINGTTKTPSSGTVDLGTVITSHQDISGKQDKLVSGTNIKTINGTSILGSGDIVIEGGSSSGGAYAEVSHGTGETTFTLTPNTFHVWDEVASLDLSFANEQAGVANEYLFQFASGSTATTLTLPDGLKWANDSAPTIAENMIYQVSVLKGLASVLEFNNVSLISFNVYYAGKKNEYTAEEGMTWGQWVESSYNFEGVIVTANGKILFYSYLVNDVTKDDEIISNYTYNTSYYD